VGGARSVLPMAERALQETLRRAGALFVSRGGDLVAAHFGSAAAELAVCRHGVGIADRGDLAVLELRGTPAAVAAVVERITGARLGPGHAVRSGAAWWCPVTRHRVLVLADRAAAADVAVLLSTAAGADADASIIDLSGDYATIGLIGPRAQRVVRDGGLLESSLLPGLLLREDVDSFLLLVPDAHGERAWEHLMGAGRVHGVTCVGRDALDRLRACPRTIPAL
jgi:glycine cleavage system aminomethyltransferase T